MTTILITLWFYGYDITLDAKEIYGVRNIVECSQLLELVKMEYEAHTASCFRGDIEDFPSSIGENI